VEHSSANEYWAGIVLAGGQSRRMGTDKAVIDFDGMTLLRRSVAAFQQAQVDEVVVVGRTELPEDLGTVKAVADRQADAGPLGGIVTGLLTIIEDRPRTPAAPVDRELAGAMVLACDLPFVDAAAIRMLLDRAHASPHAPGVLGHDGEQSQPLCSLIRADAFGAIIDAFNDGVFSPMGIFTSLGFTAADPIDDGRLSDVDTPDDLARAERRLMETSEATFTEFGTESG